MSNDIETIASIRDMQGSDGKEGNWYILGEPQRAALTRIIDALSNPDGHAKVLLDEAKRCREELKYLDAGGEAEHEQYAIACEAGAIALGLCREKDRRIEALEAALEKIKSWYIGPLLDCNKNEVNELRQAIEAAQDIARRALEGDDNAAG